MPERLGRPKLFLGPFSYGLVVMPSGNCDILHGGKVCLFTATCDLLSKARCQTT